jgi:hypothetical protein
MGIDKETPKYDVYSKEQLIQIISNKDKELEWLRYFYNEVDSSLGPASYDIYQLILESYTNNGKYAPVNYYPDFEPD